MSFFSDHWLLSLPRKRFKDAHEESSEAERLPLDEDDPEHFST